MLTSMVLHVFHAHARPNNDTTRSPSPFVRPVPLHSPDLAFDIAYYIFGSIFRLNSRVIYFFLDWGGTPGRAVTMSLFLLLLGLPLAHGVHVLMAAGRDRLRRMRPDWGWQVGRTTGRHAGGDADRHASKHKDTNIHPPPRQQQQQCHQNEKKQRKEITTNISDVLDERDSLINRTVKPCQ